MREQVEAFTLNWYTGSPYFGRFIVELMIVVVDYIYFFMTVIVVDSIAESLLVAVKIPPRKKV